MEYIMNSKKCTAIWVASIVCFAWFIFSFLKLILGSAADASQNYGPGLSLIAGIVVAIVDIVEIINQSKKVGKSLIPFVISSFKKENGKDMSRLAWALFFSISPIFILIGVLLLCSGGGTAALGNNQNKSSSTNTVSQHTGGGISNSSKDSDNYQKLNNIAGNTSNNMQQITEAKHNEIQNIVKNNPGISDEELAKIAGVNADTARAHRPQLDLSYQDINHIAGNTSNNIQNIIEAKYNEIQKAVQNNPGLSDEDIAQKFGVNIDTARASRPKLNLSYEELNRIAGSTANNIQQITESTHNEIQNMFRKNPGLSVEEGLALFNKSHPGTNIETIRAHKPN